MKLTNEMKASTIIIILIAMISALPGISLVAQEISAKEVVTKAHEKTTGKSGQGVMTMTIVRPTWSREVSMKAWSLGTEYYLIYITAPAKDAGQVFLKRGNEMWNWMPNINRMIKIPPSMMSQSWMGSDFTNDDLVRMNSIIDDFTHSFIGEETIGGYPCHKIELIPKPDAAVVWGKIIMYVSKSEYYEMKGEYFDEDGVLVNIMTASDIRQMGDRMLPARMEMVPVDKPGNKTIMNTVEMKYNVPLEEDFFSQQNMKVIK